MKGRRRTITNNYARNTAFKDIHEDMKPTLTANSKHLKENTETIFVSHKVDIPQLIRLPDEIGGGTVCNSYTYIYSPTDENSYLVRPSHLNTTENRYLNSLLNFDDFYKNN